MSLATRSAAMAVAIVVSAGCGGGDDAAAPPQASAVPTIASTAPTTTTAPSSTQTPTTSAPAPTSSSLEPPVTTADPRAVVLAAPRTGIVDWNQLGRKCALGAPGAASDMLSAQDGDGKFERPLPVQQVAVFPDVDAAVAEADRIAAAMAGCSSDPQYTTTPVEVGAQGVGLEYQYGGSSPAYPFGSYLVLTRRGNALTLVGSMAGEGSLERATEVGTDLANRGWAALCVYDRTSGC